MYNFLLQTVPFLIIQYLNNEALGKWSPLGVFSLTWSGFMTFSTGWRFVYWRFYRKMPMDEVPVTIMFVNTIPVGSRLRSRAQLGGDDGAEAVPVVDADEDLPMAKAHEYDAIDAIDAIDADTVEVDIGSVYLLLDDHFEMPSVGLGDRFIADLDHAATELSADRQTPEETQGSKGQKLESEFLLKEENERLKAENQTLKVEKLNQTNDEEVAE
jgi:hypothetical protein